MEADIYVGLDASLDETSLCIVNQAGKTERETKVATDPDAIRSALDNWRNRIARIGVRGILDRHLVSARAAALGAAGHRC